MAHCINFDWLEVYCLEPSLDKPLNADYFEDTGVLVQRRGYGTRVFAEMFTVCNDHGVPIVEVRRAPLSLTCKNGGLFDPTSCHLRLTNVACYCTSPVDLLREFMLRHGYIFCKVFRVDICNDFYRFDRGDDPGKFIDRYLHGRYSKVNQTNISAHGVDTWSGRTWNSLSWGSPSSMVSTKMYCKTLELRQVHDKPYIREAWRAQGLVDDASTLEVHKADGTVFVPDIWRVEFSIRASTAKWIVVGSGKRRAESSFYPNTLEMFDTADRLEVLFASLCHAYFRFKVFENGVRKDRCEDKVLFVFDNTSLRLRPDRLSAHVSASSFLQRLIRYLGEFCLSTSYEPALDAASTLIRFAQERLSRESGLLSCRELRILRGLMGTAGRDQRTFNDRLKTVSQEVDLFADAF